MDRQRQTLGLGLLAVGFLGLAASWWIGGPVAPLVGVATVALLAIGVVAFGTAGDPEIARH